MEDNLQAQVRLLVCFKRDVLGVKLLHEQRVHFQQVHDLHEKTGVQFLPQVIGSDDDHVADPLQAQFDTAERLYVLEAEQPVLRIDNGLLINLTDPV